MTRMQRIFADFFIVRSALIRSICVIRVPILERKNGAA